MTPEQDDQTGGSSTTPGTETPAPSDDDKTSQQGGGDGAPASDPQPNTPGDPETPAPAENETETDPATDTETETDSDEPAPRTEVRSWIGDLDALKLSSEGLSVDYTKAPALNEDAASDEDSEDATEAAPLEEFAAVLNLSFALDPAKSAQLPDGVESSVIAGDTLLVALPEGVAPADPAASIDVYQLDDNGNPTDTLIARGAFEGSSLKVTFVDPVDQQTGEAVELDVLKANIDLDVMVSMSIVEDNAHEITWTLQTDASGAAQTAALTVPGRATLEILYGSDAAPSDSVEGVEGDQAVVEDAATSIMGSMLAATVNNGPETTYSFSNYTASDQMTITWCDNNYEGRPAPSLYGNAIIPMFKVGDGEWTALLTNSGNLTTAAESALHITGDTPS